MCDATRHRWCHQGNPTELPQICHNTVTEARCFSSLKLFLQIYNLLSWTGFFFVSTTNLLLWRWWWLLLLLIVIILFPRKVTTQTIRTIPRTSLNHWLVTRNENHNSRPHSPLAPFFFALTHASLGKLLNLCDKVAYRIIWGAGTKATGTRNRTQRVTVATPTLNNINLGW